MHLSESEVGYFAFTDQACASFRFGVRDEPPAIECAFWDVDREIWVEDVELAEYLVFRPAEVVAMSVAEASSRTNGRHTDDVGDSLEASTFREPPGSPFGP